MGTRGLYGFRKNGKEKATYNHYDSYPDWLGSNVLNFIKNHSVKEMSDFYDRIIMVDEDDKPTREQIENCRNNKSIDLNVSRQSEDDWYCLTRELQGELEQLYKCDFAYMIEYLGFIKNSLFCEYAYIIDIDEEVLEFYEGFQKEPQVGNRYGVEANGSGYYPCKLIAEIPIDEIKEKTVEKIIAEYMSKDEEE